MATISFVVNPKGNGKMAIRAKFSNGSATPKYKNLGYTLPDNKVKGEYKYWDVEKNRVKGQHDDQLEINKKISKWVNDFDTYTEHCAKEGIPIDIDAFKVMLDTNYLELPKAADKTLLLVVAKEFYQSTLKTHKEGTTKGYLTMLDDIEEFEKSTKTRYRLADIDKDFYRRYGLFLIDTNNNFNNTVNRKIKRIVTVLNYAFEKKYINTLEFRKKYNFKTSPAQRFALWPAELDKLKKLKVEDPFDRKVLDSFLFSCETTLRHSDVSILKPVHKKDLPVGNKTISILDLTQEKTIHANTIALTDYAIMLWYNNVTDNNTPVFDIKHGNTANRIIKRLCKEAKLTRQCEVVRTKGNETIKETVALYDAIVFHMARNTAITVQLSKLAPAFVKDNAGIKRMDTLMGYYKDDEISRYQKTLEVMNKTKPSQKKKPQS